MERTQIISLDLDNDSVELLEKNHTVFDGSIGHQIELNLQYNGYAKCLLQHKLPKNFHEYEVLILDLNNDKIVPYNEEDHKREFKKSAEEAFIKCDYPQTIFDPRPYSLSAIASEIKENLENGFLLVVFCAENEDITYQFKSNHSYHPEIYSIETYSFLRNAPEHENKRGNQTHVFDGDGEIYAFLKRYNNDFKYEITFKHPIIHDESGFINDPDFYPLIYNSKNDIISFCSFPNENSGIFFFPQMENKREFINNFLNEIAPSFLPHLFQNNNKNLWINDGNYLLPNEEKLTTEKVKLTEIYQSNLSKKNEEIELNKKEFIFLHDLITASDENLVNALIKFFYWLEFKNVESGDAKNANNIKEEDIYIETERGLLIFEVKGIGGTSKDSDCNQIGKIKFRRCKERNKFDVYAHYIVNHQRHLPPLKRNNPPFSQHQISDAKNEERGLITTWQLYNLYFAVENGLVTKEQIKNSFYSYGNLDFVPREYYMVGAPSEHLKDDIIIITLPSHTTFSQNEMVFIVNKNGNFDKATIKSIQEDGKNVLTSTGREIGVKFSKKIQKGAILFKMAQ